MNNFKNLTAKQEKYGSEVLLPDKERRFLRLPDVCRKLGVSRSTIYLWIMQNRFPAPIKMGRMSVWLESGVDQWMLHTEMQTKDADPGKT